MTRKNTNTTWQLTLSFLFLCAFSFNIIAQTDRPLVRQKGSLPCINKTFNVVAHVVKNAEGKVVTTPGEINNTLAEVNKLFAPICVQFEVCEFNLIDNYRYDTLELESEWAELQALYGQPYKINIYFVGNIAFSDACGIAGSLISTPTNTRGILLPCNGALAHEMGHFFGLKHTFGEGVEKTEELVKGGNCETTGDFICDTPADPYITRDSIPDYVDGSKCRFINMDRDAQGEWYVPHVGNIMSYYPCACEFTDGQYRFMVETYLKNKKMW